METRGAKALHEFVAKEVAKGVKAATKESSKFVDNRLSQDRAANARVSHFKNEIDNISAEFPGFMQDEEFKAEADTEAIRILTLRLGQAPNGSEDNRFYQPGDLIAPLSRFALKPQRSNKTTPTSPHTTSLPQNP